MDNNTPDESAAAFHGAEKSISASWQALKNRNHMECNPKKSCEVKK